MLEHITIIAAPQNRFLSGRPGQLLAEAGVLDFPANSLGISAAWDMALWHGLVPWTGPCIC
jgi:hypothetical protein